MPRRALRFCLLGPRLDFDFIGRDDDRSHFLGRNETAGGLYLPFDWSRRTFAGLSMRAARLMRTKGMRPICGPTLALAAGLASVPSATAAPDAVADFYRGRQLSVVV